MGEIEGKFFIIYFWILGTVFCNFFKKIFVKCSSLSDLSEGALAAFDSLFGQSLFISSFCDLIIYYIHDIPLKIWYEIEKGKIKKCWIFVLFKRNLYFPGVFFIKRIPNIIKVKFTFKSGGF